jgi:two-component system sensor kinase FixL
MNGIELLGQRSDPLFQTLIATAVDGIIVIDGAGSIEIFNSACETLFGYTLVEVVGRNIRMLMPEPYHAEHDGYLSGYRRTGDRKIIGIGREVVGLRKNKTTFPMYLSVGEGTLDGRKLFVGIVRDLTKEKAETALREDAGRLFAQIVQSSNDAILSKTLDGIITSWNRAAEDIFGYTVAEATGQSIFMLIPPDLVDEERRIIADLQAGREIEQYETVRLHSNGSKIDVSISVSPIRNSAGTIVGASKIARDITERKRAAARALSLQSELAHVGRLSAMGQMTAGIAHELNQPLTAVTNYVNAARRTLASMTETSEQADFARELMEKAATQTLRAGIIIKNLRGFVEKRESARAPASLNKVVEEAVALGLTDTADLNVRTHLRLDPSVPPVLIDSVQIQQVLVNLIRNSVEAMRSSARRDLTLSTCLGEPGFVQVTVADTGPGLPPEVSARLFQPFVTTKDKGMGIGLTICRSILDGHGGRIGVVPGVKVGTAFRITLPLAHPDESDI